MFCLKRDAVADLYQRTSIIVSSTASHHSDNLCYILAINYILCKCKFKIENSYFENGTFCENSITDFRILATLFRIKMVS